MLLCSVLLYREQQRETSPRYPCMHSRALTGKTLPAGCKISHTFQYVSRARRSVTTKSPPLSPAYPTRRRPGPTTSVSNLPHPAQPRPSSSLTIRLTLSASSPPISSSSRRPFPPPCLLYIPLPKRRPGPYRRARLDPTNRRVECESSRIFGERELPPEYLLR